MPTLSRPLGLLLGGALLFAASLTVLFLGIRDVMEIGGSCGSGGPYEIAHPCPAGTWMVPMSIITGLAGVGLVAWCTPRGSTPYVLLAWPALFLALGWNFLEYGVSPPDGTGVAIGWLFCAVVFGLMGFVPLAIGVSVWWSTRPDEPEERFPEDRRVDVTPWLLLSGAVIGIVPGVLLHTAFS